MKWTSPPLRKGGCGTLGCWSGTDSRKDESWCFCDKAISREFHVKPTDTLRLVVTTERTRGAPSGMHKGLLEPKFPIGVHVWWWVEIEP